MQEEPAPRVAPYAPAAGRSRGLCPIIFSSKDMQSYMKTFELSEAEVKQSIDEMFKVIMVGNNAYESREAAWEYLNMKRHWKVEIAKIQTILGTSAPEVSAIVRVLFVTDGDLGDAIVTLSRSSRPKRKAQVDDVRL